MSATVHHPALEGVRAARQEFLNWREGFAEQMRLARQAQREWHQVRMEDAILAAYDVGASLRQIAEFYGVQDRRVLTKMLRTAQLRRGDDPDEQERVERLEQQPKSENPER